MHGSFIWVLLVKAAGGRARGRKAIFSRSLCVWFSFVGYAVDLASPDTEIIYRRASVLYPRTWKRSQIT